ncbi:hypothetical protein AMATHDRAFT_72077 [Amanita thiersii Skay4041]|uniref:Uncharacterized protein n=1 Tax=Amanita thiersii Skay4041 TaxID=703135 RepID=A0A2A9NBB7_9AGAR|nr:hypothetical protein AMATHDRAFT_72077 [Amanita thiersii Skay4041]
MTQLPLQDLGRAKQIATRFKSGLSPFDPEHTIVLLEGYSRAGFTTHTCACDISTWFCVIHCPPSEPRVCGMCLSLRALPAITLGGIQGLRSANYFQCTIILQGS